MRCFMAAIDKHNSGTASIAVGDSATALSDMQVLHVLRRVVLTADGFSHGMVFLCLLSRVLLCVLRMVYLCVPAVLCICVCVCVVNE